MENIQLNFIDSAGQLYIQDSNSILGNIQTL